MSAAVAQLRRKLNNFGSREEAKKEPASIVNAADDSSPSESTASMSSLPVSDQDDQGDLHLSFRPIKPEQKARNSAMRRGSSTTLDRKANLRIPPEMGKGQEKDISIKTLSKPIKKVKEAEKAVTAKRNSIGHASQREETKVSLRGEQNEEKWTNYEVKVPLRRSAQLKKLERRESRKSVLESLGKFELNHSDGERIIPQRNLSASLKRNPYAPKSSDATDEMSDGSLSLDELPPPEREDRGGRSLCSQRSFTSHNASLDLSVHLALPIYEQVMTSASCDQWARFKLLGRLGLGDIRLSQEAEVLVERNYRIMLNAVKHIYALRDGNSDGNSSVESLDFRNSFFIRSGHLLEEVQATINVPMEGPAKLQRDPNTIEVDPVVQRQLRDYIVVVCSLYRDNPFHDFEHASNVLGAVDKIIGLVSHLDEELDYRNLKQGCGVAREPWIHFALVFAALVHDVDHLGVPNAQLVKEGAQVAWAYKNKSVAEQNSIELAWNLLMEPCYMELRTSIFHLRSEFINFRSLVVTAVMATDIADKELAALRKGRAADALKAQEDEERAARANMDLVRRKATFVVETLIQIADVSHTMSSFDIYKKWNHKLYKEMYHAYKNGRADQDPTDYWYKGEFGFFDFYVIPLAKKLNECGIHGKASAEYLYNAIHNRKLWEVKGKSLVSKYIAEVKKEEEASGKARAQSNSKSVSLRGMVLSVNSEAASDFVRDGDDDSVSISSDDSEDRTNNRYHAKLAVMRQHLTAVLAGSGKVPSKASIEIKNDRRRLLRSQSANPEDLARMVSAYEQEEGIGMKIRLRSRSQSPNAPARSRSNLCRHYGSSDDDSSSDEGGRSLHSRSRSSSPGSGSERCPPRSVLKNNSPGSGSERSATRSCLKNRMQSRSGSEKSKQTSTLKKSQPGNVSPASNSEKPQERRQSRAGRKVRRGRRPSRSRSPASSVENGASEGKPTTDLKKGKRPPMAKAANVF